MVITTGNINDGRNGGPSRLDVMVAEPASVAIVDGAFANRVKAERGTFNVNRLGEQLGVMGAKLRLWAFLDGIIRHGAVASAGFRLQPLESPRIHCSAATTTCESKALSLLAQMLKLKAERIIFVADATDYAPVLRLALAREYRVRVIDSSIYRSALFTELGGHVLADHQSLQAIGVA
jgi:hypothetical protein